METQPLLSALCWRTSHRPLNPTIHQLRTMRAPQLPPPPSNYPPSPYFGSTHTHTPLSSASLTRPQWLSSCSFCFKYGSSGPKRVVSAAVLVAAAYGRRCEECVSPSSLLCFRLNRLCISENPHKQMTCSLFKRSRKIHIFKMFSMS